MDAVVTGRAIGKPPASLARVGIDRAMGELRVVGAEGGQGLVNLIGLAAPACRARLAPGGRDSVGVDGAAPPWAYLLDGMPTPMLDITVQQVPTASDLARRLAPNMNRRTGDGSEQDEA